MAENNKMNIFRKENLIYASFKDGNIERIYRNKYKMKKLIFEVRPKNSRSIVIKIQNKQILV